MKSKYQDGIAVFYEGNLLFIKQKFEGESRAETIALNKKDIYRVISRLRRLLKEYKGCID